MLTGFGELDVADRPVELEAHSVYHILPDIRQPVLILTGVFDPVIPAYQGACGAHSSTCVMQ